MPYFEDPKPIKGLSGAPGNQETTYHSSAPKDIIDLSPVEKPLITLIKVDFGQPEDWSELKPFILKVVGTLQGDPPKEPEFNFSTRVLTVSVPQAEIARVRLSSYLLESDLEIMSIWNWIREDKFYMDIERVFLADIADAWQRTDLAGKRLVIIP